MNCLGIVESRRVHGPCCVTCCLCVCVCVTRWPLAPERLDYIRDVSQQRAAPALKESTYIEVRYEDKWIDAVLFRSWAHSCISCTITHEVRLCLCRLYHEYTPCRHHLFVKLFMKQKSHFCLFTKQKEGGERGVGGGGACALAYRRRLFPFTKRKKIIKCVLHVTVETGVFFVFF